MGMTEDQHLSQAHEWMTGALHHLQEVEGAVKAALTVAYGEAAKPAGWVDLDRLAREIADLEVVETEALLTEAVIALRRVRQDRAGLDPEAET